MVNNFTNCNKTNNNLLSQTIEHKKDHNIWHWKSSSWLGTCTEMWQGYNWSNVKMIGVPSNYMYYYETNFSLIGTQYSKYSRRHSWPISADIHVYFVYGDSQILYTYSMPRYSWNMSNVGVKHQSINMLIQAICDINRYYTCWCI
jgi:hypothetical protein